MAHYCVCPKCKERFNRDIIQAVVVSARRYGHATCYPDNKDFVPLGEEGDPDLIKLREYIKNLYGEKNVRWQLINRQIKQYKNDNGYSYSGMLKSLIYFYEIKGNSMEKSNGVGIIPYVYQDAYTYYYNLFMAQEANKNKTLFTQTKDIIIKPPKMRGTKQQLFDFKEWEE